MRETFLDRGLGYLFPEVALRRASARVALDQYRAYEAAKSTSHTKGWTALGGSANSEIGPASGLLRSRSRELVRNSSWGTRAARIIRSNVVGKGITPYLSGEKDTAKTTAMDQWLAFSEHCDPDGVSDFYGLQGLIIQTVFESGECLIRLRKRPTKWNMEIPLQLEVLEPDFVDHSKNEVLNNGNVILLGREYDKYGRRVAYWLFPEHPGADFQSYRKGFTSQRVDASEIITVFDRWRPGQVAGVPWMAPVALKIRDIDDYDGSELIRKKIESCFVAFVKSSSPGGHGGLAGSSDKNDKGDSVDRVSPGRIYRHGHDQDVKFGAPATTGGYAEYMGVQLHAVAAGIGITYEQLTGNLADVNYGSLRGGKVEFWGMLDIWQHHMMIHQLCRSVWAAVDNVVNFTGKRSHSIPRANWTPPLRPWIDPYKDAQGQEALIQAGITTLAKTISDRGEDPETHLDEIEATNQMLDEREIILTSDPRHNLVKKPITEETEKGDGKNAKSSKSR